MGCLGGKNAEQKENSHKCRAAQFYHVLDTAVVLYILN